MFRTTYRLGEYCITEDENGLLRWETYFNFGAQRSGKCYIFGNILIIGNWSHEGIGYLQLEFSDRLNKLPSWGKTHYYCFASDLLDVSTGQRLTNNFLEQYLTGTKSAVLKSPMNKSPGMFRLFKYQITVTDNGDVSWQTYEGLDRVVGGPCVIESDILFIGPQEYDEGNQSKREFLNKLNQLPRWDKTIAWCRGMVLRNCLQQQETEKPDTTPITTFQPQDMGEDHFFDEKHSIIFPTRLKEALKRLLMLGFKWQKTLRSRIDKVKSWLKYLILLIVVGLLVGLITIWHSGWYQFWGKIWSHENREPHHKHNDHKRQ
jgi:hypothetical protein